MKIAFLDHSFHLMTKSSQFFVELLQKLGTVTHFYFDVNDLSTVADVAEGAFDLVVLWQTEYFAPYFLACGKRTLIVPMYDGCAGVPDLYWKSMRGARAVNFCQKLHLRHESLGLASFYTQYFPDPSKFTPVADFSSLRGFLWQRRPDHGIDWRLAYSLMPNGMESFHIHAVSDVGTSQIPPLPLTSSEWEEDNRSYVQELRKTNLFFAPRLTEGIGMTTLEAMAMGMCVVAFDDATANEYIIHRQNGCLYHITRDQRGATASALDLSPETARQMGKRARFCVEIGRERFLKKEDNLLAYIASTPGPAPDFGRRTSKEQLLRLGRFFVRDQRRFEQRLRELDKIGVFASDLNDLNLQDRFLHNMKGIRRYFSF